ncbi:MAG: Holliday junction branch migration protein RuvA [Clostridia bacterium]|nr:Holliday junction branch migration protein RuvA [Clostridia bacterium]
MIYSLSGKYLTAEPGFVVIECGGVGFQCFTSMSTITRLPSQGSNVTLYTYMNVTESAITLYGFSEKTELSCFKMLISVSGVGPKAALSILSTLTPEDVALAVGSGDYKAITRANGVGAKIAQRVVLELKDKFKSMGAPADLPAGRGAAPSAPNNAAAAINALMVLGCQPSEAAQLVAKHDATLPTEEIIRLALVDMAKGLS